jgi:5-methyltetrahydrofolate--homocysteine methyltransferase
VENDPAEVRGKVHYARDAFEGPVDGHHHGNGRGEAPDTDSPEAVAAREKEVSARPATSDRNARR